MNLKHWIAVDTFIDEVSRREYHTHPKDLNPPQEVETEKHWADRCNSLPHEKFRQTWTGSGEFFFCHWEVATEQLIHLQLDEIGVSSS